MSLNPTTLDASVRIIGDVPDPESTTGQRRAVIGTGFLCAVPSKNLPGFRYGYIVTVHHVIADQNHPEVQAPIPNSTGQALQAPVEMREWVQPLEKVDLALSQFGGHHEGWYAGLPVNTRFLPPTISPLLGQTVHYVGILEPEDRVMARSGTIGALDQEGMEHDGYMHPVHLVDCRTYGGFSGSPCYAEFAAPVLEPFDQSRLPPIARAPGDTAPRGTMDYYTWLCGMLSWHLSDDRSAQASQYGVAAMLPHYEIWRGLMELQHERDEADVENEKKIRESQPKRSNLSTGAAREESEFARFEDLARRLVQTPKTEKDKPS